MILSEQTGAAILALGMALPPYQARQADIAQWMISAFAQKPVIGRWLRSVYANSGIETRYSCIDDFLRPVAEARFAPGRPLEQVPTTAERMAIYARESAPLGAAAACTALTQLATSTHTSLATVTASITHLVITSCTGFFAPGLDIAIARHLGLPTTIGRTVIGFMGCSAAFNALRTATQIVQSQPAARVLLVCVELCSLHLQPGAERENLLSGALFADGASACVVASTRGACGDCFRIDDFHTEIKPDSHGDMVWQIGNHGFVLQLSPRIPKHLAEAAPAALRKLFPTQASQFWAIHPGGPAIVDRLADAFALTADQVAASRRVLRQIGNVSSATILFVLDELRQQLRQNPQRQSGVAMAFGPGLVIEMARLTYFPPADAGGSYLAQSAVLTAAAQ